MQLLRYEGTSHRAVDCLRTHSTQMRGPSFGEQLLCCLWSAPITLHPSSFASPSCISSVWSTTQLLLLQSGSCPRGLRNPYPDRRCLGSNRPETARATVDSSSAPQPLTLSAVLTKSKALRSQPDKTHASAPTNTNKHVDRMQCFAGGRVGCKILACPASSPVPAAPQLHLECTSTERHDRSSVTRL